MKSGLISMSLTNQDRDLGSLSIIVPFLSLVQEGAARLHFVLFDYFLCPLEDMAFCISLDDENEYCQPHNYQAE